MYCLPGFTVQLLKNKKYREVISDKFKPRENNDNLVRDKFEVVEYQFKVLQLRLH